MPTWNRYAIGSRGCSPPCSRGVQGFMIRHCKNICRPMCFLLAGLCSIAWSHQASSQMPAQLLRPLDHQPVAAAGPDLPETVAGKKTPHPPGLLLEAAVSWTLANNPALAAIREQRGIAAAGVVIARTYPFNPVLQAPVVGLTATTSQVRATILNPVQYNPQIMLALEIRGQ